MNAPKNRQSDARNSHIASLMFVSIEPCGWPWGSMSCGAGTGCAGGASLTSAPVVSVPVCSIVAMCNPRSVGRLDGPGVHAEQQHERARDPDEWVLVHRAVAHDRQAERGD